MTTNELETKFNNILNVRGFDEDSRKQLHLHTLSNFIFHFDNLPSDNKGEVFQRINGYLDLISIIKPIEIWESSEDLYRNHIFVLAKKYYPLGFTGYGRERVMLFVFVVVTSGLYLLDVSLIFISVWILFFILLAVRMGIKKKQKKVYGLRY